MSQNYTGTCQLVINLNSKALIEYIVLYINVQNKSYGSIYSKPCVYDQVKQESDKFLIVQRWDVLDIFTDVIYIITLYQALYLDTQVGFCSL